jgi:5'(3')-deoxyribonucleotidase
LKVACDFDSTLADTLKVVLDLFNFKYGLSLTREDIADWDWKVNAKVWGFTEKGAKEVEADFWKVYDLFDTTHLRRAIPPVDPMACGAVKWLVKRGHQVDIVTSNRPEAEMSIRAWLFGHGLDLPLRMLDRKTASYKAELDYDVMIDDAPSLAKAITEQYLEQKAGTIHFEQPRPHHRLLLVPQPFNRQVLESPAVRTDFTWRRAIDIFEEEGL